MSNKETNFEEEIPNNVNNEDLTEKKSAQNNTDNLLKQIKDLQEQSEKYKESYLRSIADFDNYRRRMVREIEEIRKNAAFSIIEDLLPVLDNMNLGIEASKKGENPSITIQGFQLVLDQFKAVLINNGLQEINPQEGVSFDHNEHECVSIIPNDSVEENKIITVVRLGYRLNSRLLRPASVIVSSGKAKTETQD